MIELSNSDWSNPLVMIKKPDGKYRMCLYFRKVSSITKKDLYPILPLNEILDILLAAYTYNSFYSTRKGNVPI